MRLTLPRTMLFALALILGQWLTLGHVSEHLALKADKAHSELCLHVHQLGAAAPMSGAITLSVVTHEMPVATTQPAARSSLLRHYPIRGPPPLSA
jgi:hypothetical protein